MVRLKNHGQPKIKRAGIRESGYQGVGYQDAGDQVAGYQVTGNQVRKDYLACGQVRGQVRADRGECKAGRQWEVIAESRQGPKSR